MKIELMLDRIHSNVTNNTILQLFTAFTRVLLAIGFIQPSIKKIMREPFTLLPDSNPVGHYFNALYQTGFYYEFIGWSQLIAAVLLLIPRTSHLGAFLFFPIILNIMVLTNAVGFAGTWLVTILMFLASLYLVCWHYDRWKSILFGKHLKNSKFGKYEFVWLPSLFAFGGACLFVPVNLIGLANIKGFQLKFLLSMVLLGLIFGFLVALHHRFMKVSEIPTIDELK